jgi:hypothetical protein
MTRWKAWWMIVIGCISLAVVSREGLRFLEAQGFHESRGVVVSSSVKAGGQRIFRPVIEYRYTVEGQELTGSRYAISDFDGTGTAGWADGVVARYPPGAACTVYYDPTHPDDSVLVRTVAAGSALIQALMVLAGGGFVYWGASWLRAHRSERRRSGMT